MKSQAKLMLDYINKSPTPYHAVDNLKSMLDSVGAIKLEPESRWNLEKGKTYYMLYRNTSMIAFHLSDDTDTTSGFRIAAAHTDSPVFKIKPVSSFISNGYERLDVEAYGGGIHHTWLDRPLGIAGILHTKDGSAVKETLIKIDEPLVIVPSLAIHMQRDVNEGAKFNIQNELCPIFAQAEGKDAAKSFLKLISEKANCSVNDIVSFDLMTYDSFPGVFLGKDNEFISASRLDDLSLVYSIFNSFTSSINNNQGARDSIALAFDHEECGSLSDRGANSNLLMMVLDRIFESLNFSSEEKYIALYNSFLISADMAHASHPAYPDKNEPHMPVYLNKGPVLKHNSNQSYVSSSKGSAFIKMLCDTNNIPLQEYTNRSDIRGGGTIGPMLSARYGITAADIGNPMFSMHAIREMAGTDDTFHMNNMLKAFYGN